MLIRLNPTWRRSEKTLRMGELGKSARESFPSEKMGQNCHLEDPKEGRE